MDKSRLLNWLREEYRQWEALLDEIGEARMDKPGVAVQWSIKDLVAHLTTWHIDFVDLLAATLRGEPEPPPPWPGDLEDMDEINAWIYESNHERPVREVLDECNMVFQRLFKAVEALPDDSFIHPTWRVITLGEKEFPAGYFFDHFHDDHELDVRAWLAREDQRTCLMDIRDWQEALWRQFGAAIDTFENLVRACPDDLWTEQIWPTPSGRPEFSQVWYVVYHTLFWLDLYLTGSEDGFVPPAPFALIEQDEDGPISERVYTREELLSYLAGCRERCRATIAGLTDATALRRCRLPWGEVTFAELLPYNMRHVQEHAAQLSLLLGQRGRFVPDYAIRAGDSLF